MNFSPSYHCSSSGICLWSPNGRFLASASNSRLVIRDSSSLSVLSNFVCLDSIDKVVWSPDSEFVAACVFKLGVTHLFSIRDPEWFGKISEGSLTVTDCFFSPDSRTIFTIAEFHVRISVWSLTGHNKTVPYIKFPKGSDCLGFSFEGRYLAVIEMKDGKDILRLYDAESHWKIVRSFEIGTSDCVGLAWSPTENFIAVWDSSLHYRLLVYTLDGRCMCDYSAYELALGIKSVCWEPGGKILAIGSYDERIRILNSMTWTVITEFSMDPIIMDEEVEILEERDVPLNDIDAKVALELANNGQIETRFETVGPRPVSLTTRKLDPKTPFPKVGVGELKFSVTGHFLAARNDRCSSAVWIWDIQSIRLKSVIALKRPVVTSFEWEPRVPRLAIVSGNASVFYIWTPLGSVCSRLPISESDIHIQIVRWNPLGKALILINQDKFVCCKLKSGVTK